MRRPLCCVCAAFVAIVFFYLRLSPVPAPEYGWTEGDRATFAGKIYQKEYRDGTLVLYLGNIKESGLAGQIMCYVEGDGTPVEPKSGSTAVVEGKVSYFKSPRNPGGFDALTYYRTLGVEFRLYRAKVLKTGDGYSPYRETLYRIRSHCEAVFDRVLPEKEASIMKAVLLGRKSGLDAQSKLLFQKSGIAHIFAISGLHITIIGMGLYGLLRKTCLPQFFCAAFSVCLMVAYGEMVGMGSSAFRAVFMFGMQLAAQMLGRTYDMLTAMAVAAVLILAEQPLYLHNAGFLLSFGAVLGIGCFGDVMKPEKRRIIKGTRGCRIRRVLYWAEASLCGSLAIFVVHFPIMLCTYYEFPVYSFFLNLVIIPAMPVLMVLGLACLGLGSLPMLAWSGMAQFAGLLCHVLLSAFDWVCRLSLGLPFSSWIVGRPAGWRVCVFAAIMFFLYACHQCAKYRKEPGKLAMALRLKLAVVLAAVVIISFPLPGGASMAFLDVGQGDCVWIRTAKGIQGENFLVDGGSSSESKVGQYTIVPYLKYMGVSRLDAVFLTHLDGDHISGVLEMLDGGGGAGIGIKRICISDAVIEDETYEKLVSLCGERGITLNRLKAGDTVSAYGLRFDVLHPDGGYDAPSKNAYSLVMKLELSDKALGEDPDQDKLTVLLTGDVEADGESAAADALAGMDGFSGVDIYKAAHHGSKYSNTDKLISATDPRLAVISCGEGNSYGHPHREAVERFEKAGSDILVTKDTGAIMINIKKGNYKVRGYMKYNGGKGR